jgi:hypothetical protein
MKKSKLFYVGLSASAAFSLALLLICGVGLLNPIETSLFWGVSALGTLNITFYLTVIAAYIAFTVRPNRSAEIKNAVDILLFFAVFSALLTAVFTTGGNQESWFLSFNRFLKNYGYMFGAVLGLAVASLIGSFQMLSAASAGYGRPTPTPLPRRGISGAFGGSGISGISGISGGSGGSGGSGISGVSGISGISGVSGVSGISGAFGGSDGKNTNVFPAVSIILFAVFAAALFAVWRYSSVFTLLLAMTVPSAVFALGAVFFLISKNRKVAPPLRPSHGGEFNAALDRDGYDEFNKNGFEPTAKKVVSIVIASLLFLIFAGVGIYGMVDKSEILFFPGAPIPGTVRGFQIAGIAAAVLFVVGFIVIASFELSEARRERDEERGILGIIFGNPFMRIIKSVFEILGLAAAVYYFCIVIYLPDMFIKELIFVAAGAVLYFVFVEIFRRAFKKDYSALAAKSVYLFAVVLYVVCAALLLKDSLNNGAQYAGYTVANDNFPFKFIHSFGHFSMIGTAVGIILADSLYNKFFKPNSFVSGGGRAVGLAVGTFLTGLLTVGFGHAIVLINGAGDWPPTYNMKVGETPFGEFFTVAFAAVFVAAFVVGLLADLKTLKGIPREKAWDSRGFYGGIQDIKIPDFTRIYTADSDITYVKKDEKKSRLKAVALTTLAVMIFAAFPAAALSSALALSREIVAEGDGYFIFTADAYEKIMPKAYISKLGSKRVEAAKIEVAKNEYGAMQFVFKAENDITDLNAEITAKRVGGNETIDDIGIRFERNLYGESYPEILEPLSGQNLAGGSNYPLWLSFFTAYDQTEGVYRAEINFSFKNSRGEQSQTVLLDVTVAPYALPKASHYYYNLPWTETEYTDEFYSKYRQFQNGAALVDPLVNVSWYDYENKVWDYSKPLSDTVKQNAFKNWGVSVETGYDLWNAWADIAVENLQDGGRPYYRIDYLTVLVRDKSGIGNAENWDGESWSGEKWESEESQIAYSYYYFLNSFLLSKKIDQNQTLADRVIVKWKDEWDQPQFFPSSPSGRTLGREELYRIYELEIIEMNKARADAMKDANALSGMQYLANVNPIAENMDILFDYFDIYCPLSYAISDDLVEYCHERGKVVWLYTCVQPFAPYANQFAYNQLYETRVTQWQVYQARVEGYWLWNSEYKNHSNYFYGFNGYLDGVFIYYEDGIKPAELTEGSFMTGIRFETATESIEEAEMFIMLENLVLDLKNRGKISEKKAAEILGELNGKISDCIKSMSVYTSNSKKMSKTADWTRKTIGELYSEYYSASPKDFSDAVEGKWNTLVNPF